MRTLQQNKQLHTLFSKLKIDAEVKSQLVHQYTEGRTAKSSEMDVYECQNLTNHLRAMLGQGYVPAPVNQRSNNDETMDKQRKRLIAKFREMGYNTIDNKADMKRINVTLIKYWKKGINQYDSAELNKIIGVVQDKWIKSYYEKRVRK
jgi:hypothetical protein